MGWVTPRTWATADVITAAALNQDVRDNEIFLASLPRVRAYSTVNVSISNNAWGSIALDAERWDTDAQHDLVTNNSRLTCKTAGMFGMFGSFDFASNATGKRGIRILLNGADQLCKMLIPAVNGDATGLSIYTEYVLAVNDYVEMQAFQDSGGALNVSAVAKYSPEFGMSLKTGF